MILACASFCLAGFFHRAGGRWTGREEEGNLMFCPNLTCPCCSSTHRAERQPHICMGPVRTLRFPSLTHSEILKIFDFLFSFSFVLDSFFLILFFFSSPPQNPGNNLRSLALLFCGQRASALSWGVLLRVLCGTCGHCAEIHRHPTEPVQIWKGTLLVSAAGIENTTGERR
ncbi:unnamed protein product, partial [Tuber aestivum]